MMKLWSSVLVLVVAVLVAVGSASAQEKKKRDKKGEGKRPTAEQMAERIFQKLDTDPKDDVLTLKEFQASPRMKDKDKAKETFDKIEKKDEGKVTKEEFTKWMKKRMAEHRKEGGKKGEGGKRHKKGEKKEK